MPENAAHHADHAQKEPASLPHSNGAVHPVFRSTTPEQLDSFQGWLAQRESVVSGGSLANEVRVLKRFLRKVVEVKEHFAEQPESLMSEQLWNRLADDFYLNPFLDPLPLAAALFNELPASAVPTAKSVIRTYLPFVAPEFDLDRLDLLTPTRRSFPHPLVENWLSHNGVGAENKINLRARVKKFLAHIVEKELQLELPKVDLVAEEDALLSLLEGTLADELPDPSTIVSCIATRGREIFIDFRDAQERFDKHLQSALGMFFAYTKRIGVTPFGREIVMRRRSAPLTRGHPRPETLERTERSVSRPHQEVSRRSQPTPPSQIVQTRKRRTPPEISQPAAGNTPSPAAKAKPPAKSPKKKGTKNTATPGKKLSARALGKADFAQQFTQRQEEHRHSHLGRGSVIDLGVAMQELLIVTLSREPINLKPSEIRSLTRESIVLEGGRQGIYQAVEDSESERLPLSEELAGAFESFLGYTKTLIPYARAIQEHPGATPLFINTTLMDGSAVSEEEIQDVLEYED